MRNLSGSLVRRALCAILALVAGTTAPLGAHARPPEPTAPGATPLPPLLPEDVSGRDFSGLKLGITPQNGPLVFAAQRAQAWTEEPAAIDATSTMGGPVQRIMLRGDVRVKIGSYRLWAARATAWIEQLEPSTKHPGHFVQQVAIYFDRVGDPAGEAGVAPCGDRLLVTAVIDGPVEMHADVLSEGRPGDGLIVEGEKRLARFLCGVMGIDTAGGNDDFVPDPAGTVGTGRGALVPGMSQLFEPGSPLEHPLVAPGRGSDDARLLPPPGVNQPIFAKRGVVTLSAGEPALLPGPDENTLVVTGGVVVQYSDLAGGRNLVLSAQRAVIFMDPGELRDVARTRAENIRGIYLEGDVVASDGTYTLRGPRIYYDLRTNQAMVLDAVYWTYDEWRGLPLYVRAKALRQTARNQLKGEGVTISTSSFFTPQLAVGTSSVTVTRQQRPSEPARTYVQARGVTPEVLGVPFLWFPYFAGDTERFLIQDVTVENSSASGMGVRTRWDLFGLLGIDPPGSWQGTYLLDYALKRGLGTGANVRWNDRTSAANLQGYIVPDDRGTDVLVNGTRRDKHGETRGMFLGDHRLALSEHWTSFLELSYLSDENFIQSYDSILGVTRREVASSAYLRRLDENSSLGLLAKGSLNDFTPNQYLLQSQGYSVDKAPEASYTRLNDQPLGSGEGMPSWSHEYRYSRARLHLVERSPRDFGFVDRTQSLDAFGVPSPDTSLGDHLRASGLRDDWVDRLDTRQEVSTTVNAGPVKVTPFVTGRVTYWNDPFDLYSAGNHDTTRLWYDAGVTGSTTLTRVYDDVENSLLDIHRLRHLVEPSITLWHAGTNRGAETLPVFDDQVEAINAGSAVRTGVAQTFQTQRGGPGRWRSVDLLKLRTDVIWSSEDTDERSPIGRFLDDRPEDSALGRYFEGSATLQLTDAVALTGTSVFDFDTHQQARSTVGVMANLSRDIAGYAELRYLNPRDVTYLNGGLQLRLTSTYTLNTSMVFDTSRGQVQSVSFRLDRVLPSMTVGFRIGYNAITDETSLGVTLVPEGRDPRREQLRRLSREQFDSDFTAPAPRSDVIPGS